MEYLGIWGFCAIIAAVIAAAKGRSGVGWFLLGLCFGPFAWAVALLPSLKTPPAATIPEEFSGRRPCPECGEPIMVTARKCRFCGSKIAPLQDLACHQCGHLNLRDAKVCAACGLDPNPPAWVKMLLK